MYAVAHTCSQCTHVNMGDIQKISLQDRKCHETRARLEDAAVTLVLRDGLEHTPVDAISELADDSPRTFFNYFDSKESAIMGLRQLEINDDTTSDYGSVSRTAEPIMPLYLFKHRNFNLTTAAGLIIGISIFGALAYLPTYPQMVTGANATKAGFLMIPMMAALLVTSIVSGQLVSTTGRYKALPAIGTDLVGVSLVLLSTMTPGLAIWQLCSYLAVMGVGLGLSVQILILIAQNSFPNSRRRRATSSSAPTTMR